MSQKLISLRLREHCAACSRDLPVWMEAWYDAEAKSVMCVDCHHSSTEEAKHPVACPPTPPPIEVGAAGRAWRDARVARTWGRLAPVVQFVSDEPEQRGDEEHRLAQRLERQLVGDAILLHSRQVPGTRGNIDHLVIAPSGVWVVDADNRSGKVERREVGSRRAGDPRLFVDGRNRTRLVDGTNRQANAVRNTLLSAGFDQVPVHPTLLFTNSEWAWFARPLEIRGVQVMWPKKLCELASEPGPLRRADVETIAGRLNSRLRVVAS